jgi:hypothetical protein
LGGQRWLPGWFANETLGVSRVGGIENHLTMRQDLRSLAAVDHGRRHQTKSGMMVLMVVPLKKALAESTSILD